MPDFMDYNNDSGFDFGGFAGADQSSLQTAAKLSTPNKSYGTAVTLAGSAALGIIDLADTIATSIPGITRYTGLERGQVNQKALNIIGSPGLSEFYMRNKEGAEVASGIYGIIASEFAVRGVAKVAAPFAEGLKTLPFARRMFALDTQYQRAMESVRAMDTVTAMRGLKGAEEFVAAARVPVQSWGKSGIEMSERLVSRTSLVNSAVGFGASRNIAHAAAVEAVMGVTLNSNNFLYSEDVAQNALFVGLGIGIPAAVGAVQAGYAIKRFAQSDHLNRLRAGALDPTGLESRTQNAFGFTPKGADQYFGGARGVYSDEATNFMVQAQAKAGDQVDSSTYNQIVQARTGQAFTSAEKITQSGIYGVKDSKFKIGKGEMTSPEGRTLKAAMKADAAALYGVEMAGRVDREVGLMGSHTAMQEQLSRRIELLRNSLNDNALDMDLRIEAQRELKQLNFMRKTTPGVVMPDGERVPLSHAAAFDEWQPPKIQAKAEGQSLSWEAFDPITNKPVGIAMDQDLGLFISKRATGTNELNGLGFDKMLQLHRMRGKAAESLAQKMLNDPKFKVSLMPQANWLQLDTAERIMQLTDGRARINFPKGLDREAAQVESFAQKVDLLKDAKIDWADPVQVARARIQYNLPQLTAYQMGVLGTQQHPLDVLLRGALEKGGGDAIRGMTLADLKIGFTEAKRIDDLSSMSVNDVKSIMGNSDRFLLDEAGREGAPVLVYSRPLKPHDWTKDVLADRITSFKFQQMNALTGPAAPEMIRELATPAYMSADLAQAARVNEMTDLSLASVTPGFQNVSPNSAVGALQNSVQSAQWRARDNPVLLAATRLREGVQRRSAGYAKRMFDQHLGDKLDRLAAPNMLETNTLLDQWHTPGVASGWDLEKQAIRVSSAQAGAKSAKEYWGFVLKDTEANKARFKAQFGREMPKAQTLVGPNGKQVVLDDLGLDLVQSVGKITDDQWLNANAIRRSGGLGEIEKRDWYVSPPDLSNKFIAVTLDSAGKPVPGGMIIANTEDSLKKQMNLAKQDGEHVASKPGNILRTQQEIADYGSVWDRAQMSMMDANEVVLKGGKHQAGLNAVGGIIPGSFTSAMNQIRNNYMNMGQDVLEIVLNDQIKMAKHRSHIAQGESKSRMSMWKGMTFRSSYDYWLQEIRGTTPLASQGSIVGRISNPIEGTIDRLLQETSARVGPTFGKAKMAASDTWHLLTDWATKRMPWTNNSGEHETFNTLVNHLGDFMPYKDVDDMLMKRGFNTQAITSAEIQGNMSRFTSAWMLRMFEPAAAMMNMAGVVNTMPAVMRSFAIRAGESTEEYAARIGHSATLFTKPDGSPHGVVDMAKVMARGMRDSLKPDDWMKAFQAETRSQGLRDGTMYEFQKQLASIESVSQAKAFFVGNPKSKNKFMQKGLVGWSSILTDSSENFSRAISLDVGARLARDLGITDVQKAIPFAHDLANRMIANYSPHNRPEIFQGVLGTPFGLFQSYMQNFYERMFRYIEVGDYRTAAIQSATQGTLFGLVTIPGMDKAQELFFNASDGETSPYDSLIGKFGPDAGDLLMAGTLSNIPKLFGGEAMALYSRGDTAARLPGFSQPAAFAVVSKVKNGVTDALALFSERQPQVTSQQVGEILSNMIPNRPIAGMVESLMAGGKDTDSYGQLVTENLNWMESTYRMMGIRSLRQSKDLESYYLNKQQMEIKAGQDEVLREGSRSLIRARGEEALPELFEAYIQNGGDERNFTRWYRDNYVAATETRSSRMLDKLMNDPDKMGMVNRLLENEVGVQEESEEDDPFGALTGPDPMDGQNPTNDVNQAATLYDGLQ